MKITFISDTHTKHKEIRKDLPGGDLIIHAGDFMNSGYDKTDATEFFEWFDAIDNYDDKIFIAGNHDWGFVKNHDIAPEYKEKGVHYLFDSMVEVDGVKIYGSPWQPEFYDWAFNLPRGEKLAEKWSKIPEGLDILITHGPAHGMVDHTMQGLNVGCEDLFEKIMEVQPKIHVCGHIHWAYGQKSFHGVEFLNASVLNERYQYQNKPIVIEYNPETKEIEYV